MFKDAIELFIACNDPLFKFPAILSGEVVKVNDVGFAISCAVLESELGAIVIWAAFVVVAVDVVSVVPMEAGATKFVVVRTVLGARILVVFFSSPVLHVSLW